MKKRKIIYNNILLFASLQFSGNIEEYFREHAKKLVVIIIQPRIKNKGNLARIYENGTLKKTEKIILSENIFKYYFLWYKNYLSILLKYFNKNEKIYIISFHPITFFGMIFQKRLRNITFVYWVGDYFPPNNFILYLFEKLKKYYHDRIPYTFYLGEGINRKLNGKVVENKNRKTVMWGIKVKKLRRILLKKRFSILFVGVIKDSQGLEYVFDFLQQRKDCFINIIGVCDQQLYERYKKLIKERSISKQVFFPNRFFSDSELNNIARKSNIGIALYNTDKTNPTYYTDPGKVKAYAEMNLPVIMTNVSAVAQYVKKFNSGILISQDREDLIDAISTIQKKYPKYEEGLKKFNNFFFYETYYKNKFTFLEYEE